jgi:hypothetical protein
MKELKSESKIEGASISEIVRKALKTYFFKLDFERARQKSRLEAARKGVKLSEEDILFKLP